ncbi:MAG TPA: hypothetical protein DEO88_13495 [Syntrophobacteraceae bacterium]|nr:hypothetical protein [Syntrophobacteraceae bacterium]
MITPGWVLRLVNPERWAKRSRMHTHFRIPMPASSILTISIMQPLEAPAMFSVAKLPHTSFYLWVICHPDLRRPPGEDSAHIQKRYAKASYSAHLGPSCTRLPMIPGCGMRVAHSVRQGGKCVTQQTLKRDVSCVGIGLHTGREVLMRLRPALPDSGIRFCRVDLPDRPLILARSEQVVQTEFATTLGRNGVTVSTTEHLLAALLACGVDNALIELNAPEVPIFDGSASPYLALIRSAGSVPQASPRYWLKVARTIEVRDGESYIRVSPSEQLQIAYTIDYPHPLLGRQSASWRFSDGSFEREIAGARTFGFLKDLHQLQAMGLARGGSLANAIVFDDKRVLNLDGFRFGNECARHKILDLMGDLSLVGRPVLARIEAYKAGHTLHNLLVRKLVATPDRYQIIRAAAVNPGLFNFPDQIANLRSMPMPL